MCFLWLIRICAILSVNHQKALADAGAFWFVRFSPVGGGYCRVWCIAAAARWYPAFAAEIRFAVRWAQRPAACPALRSDFRGALRGGRYLRLSERRCAFLHYYNYKSCVTAGRLCLRVCAFAAVCGISSVRGFFIYRRAARISPEMRNFAGNVFCREAHLRTALPSSAEKFFPAGARCRARVLFRRIFRSEFRGENAFLEAPQNDTFCKFERKFIHFTQFFIDKRHCLPYN